MKTLLALPRVWWIAIASIYSCTSVFFIRLFFIFASPARSMRFSQKYMLSHWGRQILKMFRVKVELRRKYENGIHVALFSEGTTSAGAKVLPFKKSAFQMGMDIVPCGIKYRCPTGFNPAWYGDLTFLPHFFTLFYQPKFEVKLRSFPKLKAADFNDPMKYLETTREMIRAWVTAPWDEEDAA
jgi:hypothetical protein